MLSIKNRALIAILLMTLVVVSISAAIISTLPAKPPLIHGILIPDAIALDEFSLIDHNNLPFTNKQLEGKWHLLSYGFTNCPDICPTVLSVLSDVTSKLDQQQQYADLSILFYSIDHQRDTATQLAAYLAYFNDDFIGLTYIDSMLDTALPFEKSLGMVSTLSPVLTKQNGNSSDISLDNSLDNSTSKLSENDVLLPYTVSHGFVLYLINPRGELQAVFRPEESTDGSFHFSEQQIIDDYVAIRNYLG